MSNIVLIGDSLIATTFLTTPFHVLLSRMWSTTGVINLGVGGDNIANITARKEAVLDYHPSIIICQFGTNDITFGTDTAAGITAGLASLYDYFKNTAKSEVWVFTCPPSEYELAGNASGTDKSTRFPIRLDVNEWIRNKPTYVDKVMDAWTVVRDPTTPQLYQEQYRDVDSGTNGVTNHYNEAGLQAIITACL